MMDCVQLAELVHGLPLVERCDAVRSGALRMSTPFLYPNGEHVDVFLESRGALLGIYRLSDSGQTSDYLMGAQVSARGTARKKEIINDVISQSDVKFLNGDFYIDLSDMGGLSDAILRLSQVCVRVSDFATHQRLRSSNSFRDDVEDFLEAHGLNYVPDVKVTGGLGKEVRVDFVVKGETRSSYVNVLAAMNESSAQASAYDIFIKWHDLDIAGQLASHRPVTIYNSASQAIKAVDLSRLKLKSDVVSYPEEGDYLIKLLQGEQLSRGTVGVLS